MATRYHPPETHNELTIITLESYVVPAHDVRVASSDELDRLYGAVPGSSDHRPSRIKRMPAERHFLNHIREPGQWVAISDDGYTSYQVGELKTTNFPPSVGFVALKNAEVELAKRAEVTEGVSAALLFTALERYSQNTRLRVGREVTLAALGNFTEKGSSVGSIREWLLESSPWLAEGEKSAPGLHYLGVGQVAAHGS